MINKSTTAIDAHIGARMRARREALSMSLAAFAGELGVTFEQVQNYEEGKNRIGTARLMQIASVLRVSELFFFEGMPRGRGEAA